jgi:hypothetical protein
MQTVIFLRFQGNSSWKTICERFSATGLPGLSSCREWTISFAVASEVYLKRLLTQLAVWQLEPGKLEIAINDVSEWAKRPWQLLAAVPHLLAWLQHTGLRIPDGPKRWLEVIWQWGHTAKLGRLV